MTRNNTYKLALDYMRQGWSPIPVPYRKKSPVMKAWNDLILTETNISEHFCKTRKSNIGVIMGEPSGWLIDIDLDCDEAIWLAPCFLPTTLTFGRESRPKSHWLFYAHEQKSRKFQSPDSGMLVEIRGSRLQTVFPGSTHPSGEVIEFASSGPQTPTDIEQGVLEECVVRLASASLLARNWPKEGGRHEAALALGGGLTRVGWECEDIANFVFQVAKVAGDEEAHDRKRAAQDSYQNFLNGNPTTGWPRIAQIFGNDVSKRIGDWLGYTNSFSSNLPQIELTLDEQNVIDQVITHLPNAAPGIFTRGNLLVRINPPPSKNEFNNNQSNHYRIEMLPAAALRESVSSHVRLVERKFNNGEEKIVPKRPPKWLLDGIASRGYWQGFHELTAVTNAPVIDSTGKVIDQAGYHPDSGIYFVPTAHYQRLIPSSSQTEAQQAAVRILEVFQDFPLDSEVSKSCLLAALITPLARYGYEGPAPLFLIDANAPGTGKTLIADSISIVAQGCPIPRMTLENDDSEMRKRITALGLGGQNMVLLDNIAGDLGCPSLDAALTSSGYWEDRVLGKSEIVRTPLNLIWFATGNNVSLKADTSRRTLHIRLESDLEHPEDRSNFKHPHLLKYIKERRAVIVMDCLTILSCYIKAGRPRQEVKSWGSFDGWNRLISHAIVWAGLEDPTKAREKLRENADTEMVALHGLLLGIRELDPTNEGLTSRVIIKKLEKDDDSYPILREAVSALVCNGHGNLPTPQKLGRRLNRFLKRTCKGMALTIRGKTGGSNLWSVEEVNRTGLGE
jgi:hypothetical protein